MSVQIHTALIGFRNYFLHIELDFGCSYTREGLTLLPTAQQGPTGCWTGRELDALRSAAGGHFP
jgi:hypothetical protein